MNSIYFMKMSLILDSYWTCSIWVLVQRAWIKLNWFKFDCQLSLIKFETNNRAMGSNLSYRNVTSLALSLSHEMFGSTRLQTILLQAQP